MSNTLIDIFEIEVKIKNNLIILEDDTHIENQKQTNKVFSNKWEQMDKKKSIAQLEKLQKNWYLQLYGFKDEKELQHFLQTKKYILDAGCGLGYKSAWFAELAPSSLVIGMDYSNSILQASKNYQHIENLYFVKGDIAKSCIKENSIDYVNCDQVIHHTEAPRKTFDHLSKITKNKGEFACYVYAKKALPRELLDEYFREYTKKCSEEELWKMSESLTQLGKTLSELNITIEVPGIPLLGIKEGTYDLQRFIYWNFIKCYYNKDMGYYNSISTNFDWYASSNAKRYSEEEFIKWIEENNLEIIHFHKEEACFSGRFKK